MCLTNAQVTATGALAFKPQPLSWQSGTDHIDLQTAVPECCSHIPVLNSTCHPAQTSWRVQDMLARLGEVACSHDVASCMLFPQTMTEHFHMGAQCADGMVNDMCSRPEIVLRHMQGHNSATRTLSASMFHSDEHKEAYRRFTAQLESIQPSVSVHKFDSPQHLMMWRVDIPPRPIVYTGLRGRVTATRKEAHMESKCMLNCRMPKTCVSNICSVASAAGVRNIKADITQRFSNLGEIHETGMVQVKQLGNIMTTTMVEAVASFTLKDAEHHTKTPLGASVPWESDSGIDPRYSELQEGSNGIRLVSCTVYFLSISIFLWS